MESLTRRHMLQALGGATLAALGGCTTRYERSERPYSARFEERLQSVWLTVDGQQLCVVGHSYHYLFSIAFFSQLDAKVGDLKSGKVSLSDLLLTPDGNVTSDFTVSINGGDVVVQTDPSSSSAGQKIKPQQVNKRIQDLRVTGSVSGRIYRAERRPEQETATTLRQRSVAWVVKGREVDFLAALPSSPLVVDNDGNVRLPGQTLVRLES